MKSVKNYKNYSTVLATLNMAGLLLMMAYLPAVLISATSFAEALELKLSDPVQYAIIDEQKTKSVQKMTLPDILSSPHNYSDWVLHYLSAPIMLWGFIMWVVSIVRTHVKSHQWALSFFNE